MDLDVDRAAKKFLQLSREHLGRPGPKAVAGEKGWESKDFSKIESMRADKWIDGRGEERWKSLA
jgi:hypothetical protein